MRLISGLAVASVLFCLTGFAAERPNIIYILADDWGLGDVKTYGGERCQIDTPHMDQLAADGMKFMDAHTTSAVCTPSRYSVLTGRYNWRSMLKQGVINGFGKPIIEPGRETVASMLKGQGYATGMIGKWHLGMDFPKKGKGDVDWKGVIQNGPNAVGFDYFWGISASLDMPPYIWIENDRFVGECTTTKAFPRKGPAHADFEAVDVLPTLAGKAAAFVADQAKTDQPFFLYMPLNSPHTPIVPSSRFKGKSRLSRYGDFVMETDWTVGEVVKAVEQAGIAGNTLIIVTADNGCAPAARNGLMPERAYHDIVFRMGEPIEEDPEKHYGSDIYRGHKTDIYEGGHRVPFIARWDGKVKAGSVSDDPICLVDLFATCAEIVNADVADTSAEDSVSILPVLLGTADGPIREAVLHHSSNGSFAIRQGKWKLAFCPGSGGWSGPMPATGKPKKNVTQIDPAKLADHEWVQLFDLSADPAETRNLSGQYPEVVKQLTSLAQKYIDDGRSTPGTKQQNNGATHLYPKWIQQAQKERVGRGAP